MSVVDTRAGLVTATVPVGQSAVELAVSSDGSRAYVTDFTSDSVAVVDTAVGVMTASIPVGDDPI